MEMSWWISWKEWGEYVDLIFFSSGEAVLVEQQSVSIHSVDHVSQLSTTTLMLLVGIQM